MPVKAGEKLEDIVNDELQIYRGKDFFIKEGILIHQPTLDEICTYGEQSYYSMIYTLTSVPADFSWQLDETGVDYTKISDFELFYSMLCRNYTPEQTSILFGNLDFSRFQPCKNQESGEVVLYDMENDISIDEYTYLMITDVLRKMHGLKKNCQLPGNETTKRILIEDAKEDYLLHKTQEYHSQLKNLISTMVNCEGFKYNHSEVWSMKINAFMDSVKRISKIKNADLLLQSGYSGFGINLKEIDNKQIDWLGELD